MRRGRVRGREDKFFLSIQILRYLPISFHPHYHQALITACLDWCSSNSWVCLWLLPPNNQFCRSIQEYFHKRESDPITPKLKTL